MNHLLLLLVPPFGLLVWRPEWTSVVTVLGAVVLVAYLDWKRSGSSEWADFVGSVNGTLAKVNGRLRVLEEREPEVAGLVDLKKRVKAAEESLERHAQTLAKAASKEGKGML